MTDTDFKKLIKVGEKHYCIACLLPKGCVRQQGHWSSSRLKTALKRLDIDMAGCDINNLTCPEGDKVKLLSIHKIGRGKYAAAWVTPP